MINILPQKTATLFALSIPAHVFHMFDIQTIYHVLLKKIVLCLNSIHYLFSIIIIEFKLADYGGATISCQDNFIIC